jgi:type IV secretory pathway VirB10-like protein
MTTAPRLIRAFIVAAVFVAALAAWTPVAFGQEVVPTPGDIVEPPPPQDPAPEPPPPPADPPVVVDPPPVDPPVVPDPPVDPTPVEPAAEQPVDRPAAKDEPSAHSDSARGPAQVAAQTTASTPTPDDVFAPAAELPPAGEGEDWAWTEKGDAFVFGTGGSSGGHGTAVLGSFTRFGSIATAAAGIPALAARERAARRAAQANGSGAGLALVDSSGNTMLFFNLFGGGGGGGAALVLLTAFGLVTVARMMPPDWTRAFRNSTATWRPSAYVPPIEHPG